MTASTRDLIVRFLTAVHDRDKVLMRELLHEDFATFLPQSGERNKGVDGFLAELEAYPGGGPVVPSPDDMRVLSDEERWAISPGYTVIPLASPDAFTVTYRIQYPDGRWWHVVGQIELRDGKMYRMENFFAPEMQAPLTNPSGTSTAADRSWPWIPRLSLPSG